MNTKYPKQLISFKKKDSCLSLESHFNVAKGSNPDGNPDSPLHIFDERFSRLKLIAISNGTPAECNIPVECIPDIIESSKIARNMQMKYDYMPKKENESTSIAYTQTLSGKLAGKTPADVLMNMPDGDKLLNSHYTWLKQNLGNERYRAGNEAQMKAISEASALQKAGQLSRDNLTTAPTLKLYEPGMRPLVNRKKDNKSFVYEVKITYSIGKNYPVCVEIKNFYAPVTQTQNKLLNVQASEIDKSTEVINRFNLTKEEWSACVFWMEQSMSAFMTSYYSYCFNESTRIETENRNAAKQK